VILLRDFASGLTGPIFFAAAACFGRKVSEEKSHGRTEV
jgi:hypothetical protein